MEDESGRAGGCLEGGAENRRLGRGHGFQCLPQWKAKVHQNINVSTKSVCKKMVRQLLFKITQKRESKNT